MTPAKLKEAFLKVNDRRLSLDLLKMLQQLAPSQDEVSA